MNMINAESYNHKSAFIFNLEIESFVAVSYTTSQGTIHY